MNRGPNGIISMICSVNGGLPGSITRHEFDTILMGKGRIKTVETCRKKWEMMIMMGWFIPAGDDVCEIDAEALAADMVRFDTDIKYDGGDPFENESLLRDLLHREVRVGHEAHYDR